MGSGKNLEQKESKRGRKVFDIVERIHSRRRYMGKKRKFEKCRKSVRRIRRKDECGGQKARKNRYGRGKGLQKGRATRKVYGKNVIQMG